MRIAILTLPLHTNYGGILQAYALQTILERMGHEVCVIERRPRPTRLPLWKIPYSYGKRIIKNLTGHPYPIFYEQKKDREAPIVAQNTNRFIKKYIKRLVVNEYSDICEGDFNVIVVGSDQIWRPKYFPKIETAYLNFTKDWNIKRIAYAASFGTDEWEYSPKQTQNCRHLITKFEAVSVREKSGIDLCHKYLDVNAKQVLDPTLLLKTEDYISLFKSIGVPKSPGNLLGYILDNTPEKVSFIDHIAKLKGLIPFRVDSKVENKIAPLNERIQPPLENWLRGFYDAEFVITDSFHACVFSILFHKLFFVIGNKERGMSRFQSLLSMFGLEDRLVDIHSPINLNSNIDWNDVDNVLNKKREEARRFLTNSLAVSYGK